MIFLAQNKISGDFLLTTKDLLCAKKFVSETKKLQKFVCRVCNRMQIRPATPDEIERMEQSQMVFIWEDECS